MIFRRNKKSSAPLSERELEILNRELQESATSAMPSDTSSDTFGDGSSFNNISRIQATMNQRGMSGIVARRITEPRKGWKKEDRDKI